MATKSAPAKAAAAKPAAKRAVSKRETWKAALAKVEAEAAKAFPEHVGKNEQLHSHLATASMLVDELHDTTPSAPHVI